MIPYSVEKWGFYSVFYLTGSVYPSAFKVAGPSALFAVFLHIVFHFVDDHHFSTRAAGPDVLASIFTGYTAVLSFLVVSRAQKAYSRWWEGGTLLQQLRGEWFNAFSSLLAFCNTTKDKREQVEKFEHLLVRLMSLLYSSALQQVSQMPASNFELIDTEGMGNGSLEFLDSCSDKCEVVLQWIQRLIVENIGNGVLNVAPPILSRVFQEYSRGIVNLNNVRKIAEFPYPFALTQLVSVMLIVHWFLVMVICTTTLVRPWWAGIVTFIIVFSFWAVHYIAMELEMPFGDHSTDLPLQDMQSDMNRSLQTLLLEKAQFPPSFDFRPDIHRKVRLSMPEKVLGSSRAPSTRSSMAFQCFNCKNKQANGDVALLVCANSSLSSPTASREPSGCGSVAKDQPGLITGEVVDPSAPVSGGAAHTGQSPVQTQAKVTEAQVLVSSTTAAAQGAPAVTAPLLPGSQKGVILSVSPTEASALPDERMLPAASRLHPEGMVKEEHMLVTPPREREAREPLSMLNGSGGGGSMSAAHRHSGDGAASGAAAERSYGDARLPGDASRPNGGSVLEDCRPEAVFRQVSCTSWGGIAVEAPSRSVPETSPPRSFQKWDTQEVGTPLSTASASAALEPKLALDRASPRQPSGITLHVGTEVLTEHMCQSMKGMDEIDLDSGARKTKQSAAQAASSLAVMPYVDGASGTSRLTE